MQKVIVERPRWGSRMRNKKTHLRVRPAEVTEGFDSGPRRASSAMSDKWFSEHLNPLRRYLEKQVGRPWDKVYSEISQRLDTRSVVGQHVLVHLWEFVSKDCYIEAGQVFARNYFGSPRPVKGLYVHPVTGILRSTPLRSRRRKPEAVEPAVVLLDRGNCYQKIADIWYRTRFAFHDPAEVYCVPGDATWRLLVKELRYVPNITGPVTYAQVPCKNEARILSEQQCSKKDLKVIRERLKKGKRLYPSIEAAREACLR
jgi:hypothetical protein